MGAHVAFGGPHCRKNAAEEAERRHLADRGIEVRRSANWTTCVCCAPELWRPTAAGSQLRRLIHFAEVPSAEVEALETSRRRSAAPSYTHAQMDGVAAKRALATIRMELASLRRRSADIQEGRTKGVEVPDSARYLVYSVDRIAAAIDDLERLLRDG